MAIPLLNVRNSRQFGRPEGRTKVGGKAAEELEKAEHFGADILRLCVKHGGVWTSCPSGSLTVRLRDPSLASVYSFGTKTADFHVCKRCGVVPLATSRIERRLFAVVNVNAFDDVEPSLLRRSSSTLNDEDESTRLARRMRNWIGDVVWIDDRI